MTLVKQVCQVCLVQRANEDSQDLRADQECLGTKEEMDYPEFLVYQVLMVQKVVFNFKITLNLTDSSLLN